MTARRALLAALAGAIGFGLLAGAASPTESEIERAIVGTYELVSWQVEGTTLRPPAVHGRLVFRNGQIVAMFHREKDGAVFDFSGYGAYRLSGSGWSYGFDYRLEVTGKDGRNEVVYSTREQLPFTSRHEGANLVLDHRNGERRFVFGPDTLVYMEMGEVLRTWRRLKTGL
jgi:hypothetical protein